MARNRRSPSDEALGQPEPPRHLWFHVQQVELKWLPISEGAFLLWVLAFLVLVWLVVAFVLLVL